MHPTTAGNADNPSIPPIGGEGRLHDSAGPPIFWCLRGPLAGSSSERLMRITWVVAGEQGWSSWLRPRPSKPETRVQIPVPALKHRPSPLLRIPRGSFLDQRLEFIDRRKEIVNVFARILEFFRDLPSMR